MPYNDIYHFFSLHRLESRTRPILTHKSEQKIANRPRFALPVSLVHLLIYNCHWGLRDSKCQIVMFDLAERLDIVLKVLLYHHRHHCCCCGCCYFDHILYLKLVTLTIMIISTTTQRKGMTNLTHGHMLQQVPRNIKSISAMYFLQTER